MNSVKQQKPTPIKKARALSVVDNPIAKVLEAEAEGRFCKEQTYFDAIQLICYNFHKTPLLTIGRVFVNFSRKYAEDQRTVKALEILDGLAFILRQLEPKTSEFNESDVEVVHYECLLDLEYARLGELRFARERVVNRIKELNHRRLEPFANVACLKCFETLDAVDALQPECSPAWQRIKPALKKLELSKPALKACSSASSLVPKKKDLCHYLSGWQPIAVVCILLLCSIARGHVIETCGHYMLGSHAHCQIVAPAVGPAAVAAPAGIKQ